MGCQEPYIEYRKQEAEKLAPKVAKAFRSKRIVRTKPSVESLIEPITDAILQGEPIQLVGYWGLLGGEIGDQVYDAFAILDELHERVRNVYEPGTKQLFVYADTHANINNIPPLNTLLSAREIMDYLENRETPSSDVFISDVVREHAEQGLADGWSTDEDIFDELSEQFQKKLIRGAERNADMPYPGQTYESIARAYANARFHESLVIEDMFPMAIFHTYNGPEYEMLLPRMPSIYMKSHKRGSHPPWLMKS